MGQRDAASPSNPRQRSRITNEPKLRPAAVLIGLVERANGPNVLLTRRTAHLRDHAGQISFPGGSRDPGDADDAATALREAREEVGLPHGNVEVLGQLSPYVTITRFSVRPVVGWVVPPERYVPDPFEVEEVFEVPLDFVLDESNHRRSHYVRDGERRHFYELPYRGYRIWGATAGMLVNFAKLMAETR